MVANLNAQLSSLATVKEFDSFEIQMFQDYLLN